MEMKNKLLELIPQSEKTRLLSISEEIEIHPRQVLHHWRMPMENVYFIESGLVSVSAKVDQDRFVEAWLIGREGMLGAQLMLGDEDREPPHRRVVQVSGTALRISVTRFCATIGELPGLRAAILRYLRLVLLETSQSAACNAAHTLKQRLARWLLIARNRLDSDELALTHEVLGNLLAVRRASVTECLQTFENEGIIHNARGVISIRDAQTLRHVSCRCFRLIEREYQTQFIPGHLSRDSGQPPGNPPTPSGAAVTATSSSSK
jgi:CRP-like cAMP-binding protein